MVSSGKQSTLFMGGRPSDPIRLKHLNQATTSPVHILKGEDGCTDEAERVAWPRNSRSMTQCWQKFSRGYASFVSRCPYVFILMTLVLLVATTWSSHHFHPLPDFKTDQSKGFSPRGTHLSKTMFTLERLNHALRFDTLAMRPVGGQTLEQVGISPADFFGMVREESPAFRGTGEGNDTGEGDDTGEGEGTGTGEGISPADFFGIFREESPAFRGTGEGDDTGEAEGTGEKEGMGTREGEGTVDGEGGGTGAVEGTVEEEGTVDEEGTGAREGMETVEFTVDGEGTGAMESTEEEERTGAAEGTVEEEDTVEGEGTVDEEGTEAGEGTGAGEDTREGEGTGEEERTGAAEETVEEEDTVEGEVTGAVEGTVEVEGTGVEVGPGSDTEPWTRSEEWEGTWEGSEAGTLWENLSDAGLDNLTAPRDVQPLQQPRQKCYERVKWSFTNEQRKKIPCTCTKNLCFNGKPVFVFEAVKEGADLFTAAALRSMCHLQDTVIYPQSRDMGSIVCEAISIPNLIGRHVNKSCHDLTEEDVSVARQMIERCGPALDGTPDTCSGPALELVTLILDSLAQRGFYERGRVGLLRYAAVYMVGTYRDELTFYLRTFHQRQVHDHNVRISAVRFAKHYNIRWDLLGQLVFSDLKYFAVALVLVLCVMTAYLRSLLLMLALSINVCASLSTAYFLYHFILRIPFFPALNLLAGLVLIAVGADDMFIMYDCWQQTGGQGDACNAERLYRALQHASPAVIVTSLTTASAFLATASSAIIAIKVFSLFSGLCVLMNLFYMLTLVPAAIICMEKLRCNAASSSSLSALTNKLHHLSRLLFHHCLPLLVARCCFLWLTLFLALGLGACYVVFISPKFKLSDKQEFQWFPKSNVIQNWDLTMLDKFQCVIRQKNNEEPDKYIHFNYVFGFHANDPRNSLDPDDKGKTVPLRLDSAFDIANPQTQLFLYNMCHDLVKQPFIPDNSPRLCHFDNLLHAIKKYCQKARMQETGCCPPDPISFPIEANMFRRCVAFYHVLVLRSRSLNNQSMIMLRKAYGHFLFNTSEHRVIGYTFDVVTNWLGSFSFHDMERYDSMLEAFLGARLLSGGGGGGLQSGFVAYHDWFWMYNLQRALTSGTFSSIALSVAVAFVVMLLTSRSPVLALYAMLTISLAIMCTIATLVFLGWQLNIVESIILSLAVGLSIDFTIHYGVAYRLSDGTEAGAGAEVTAGAEAGTETGSEMGMRKGAEMGTGTGIATGEKAAARTGTEVMAGGGTGTETLMGSRERVAAAFCMVSSAVTMAALTTFLAGAAVLPCHVLIYVQLGVFLMVVTALAWLYATFFFQSLLHVIGPSHHCYASIVHKCRTCQTTRNQCCQSCYNPTCIPDKTDSTANYVFSLE